MGNQPPKGKNPGGPVRGLEGLLKDAMRLAHVAVSDIYSYREGIKPAIDKITGDKEKVVQMEVEKKKIYEHAMARYIGKIRSMRTGMKPTHECPVITFIGEDENEFDVDGSGFRRQYYSIFFQECLRRLFEGSGRNQLPKHDLTKKEEFTALGIAIVEAILNGDCGFPYMNNAVFMLILGKSDDEIDQTLIITDIPLGDVWNTVKKIQDAKTESEMTEAISEDSANFLNFIGWPGGQLMTLKNKHSLLHYITKWYVIDQRLSEIDQLKKGLNYMGFLDTIRSNTWFEPLFVYSEQYSITANYVKQKLEPLLDKLPTKTDTQRKAQKQAKLCIDALDETQARLLFAFITGLYDPPIIEETFCVEFNTNPDMCYPTSYTCLNKLFLPLGNKDIDKFKESFWAALYDVQR
ncbi:uncharacterized protein LOC134685306 [Mytilus trossulus]|uniref:uncharacterized protein LOC134685306 n=1 Tax=Mytilus trossulus TaxID=6551 RepID=UPI003003CC85